MLLRIEVDTNILKDLTANSQSDPGEIALSSSQRRRIAKIRFKKKNDQFDQVAVCCRTQLTCVQLGDYVRSNVTLFI